MCVVAHVTDITGRFFKNVSTACQRNGADHRIQDIVRARARTRTVDLTSLVPGRTWSSHAVAIQNRERDTLRRQFVSVAGTKVASNNLGDDEYGSRTYTGDNLYIGVGHKLLEWNE